jgi:hypothetical protein
MSARAFAFGVDVARMHAAARRLTTWGAVLAGAGALFALVGLPFAAYGVLAIGMHTFDGTGDDFLAGLLVLAFCFAPLTLSVALLTAGTVLLVRGSRLRELRSLLYGRESVTTSELASRTRRTEREARALLARAERYRAAWPLGPS